MKLCSYFVENGNRKMRNRFIKAIYFIYWDIVAGKHSFKMDYINNFTRKCVDCKTKNILYSINDCLAKKKQFA